MNTDLNHSPLKPQRFNRRLSIVLHTGIAISLLLIVAGLVLSIISGKAMDMLTPPGLLVAGLLELDPSTFITTGLIITLLLPAVILLSAFTHFITSRQKQPALVCTVLMVLMFTGIAIMLILHM